MLRYLAALDNGHVPAGPRHLLSGHADFRADRASEWRMRWWRVRLRVLGAMLVVCGLAVAGSARAQGARTETVDEALCRMIEGAATASRIPTEFFTRLIWRESTFRPGAVSPKGALGVAQFMPGTAAERGLADPFDPEQAIPKAAALLADLERQFGNLGLAAAAYNGGPTRVQNWLDGRGGLPGETREYVSAITGRTAEDWAELKRNPPPPTIDPPPLAPEASCVTLIANIRRGRDQRIYEPYAGPVIVAGSVFAPWGVQVAGNFIRDRALASFARARQRHAAILGEGLPMIIGTRLRSRGTRAFYRVRLPAQSREAANALCGRLRSAGGACIVLKS
jgi:hypothetical protein